MKYLIVKGWLGFGDRLESLRMCIKYALEHKLEIYVDWTDKTFSHGNENFYSYFDLDMPKCSLDVEGTTFPPCWTGNLHQRLTDEFITKNPEVIYQLGKVYNEDIVVYSCIADRYIYGDTLFFAQVFKITESIIIQKVKDRQWNYNLKNKIAIHLRGTDRAGRLNKLARFKGVCARMVSLGSLSGREFIAVSDDTELSNMWRQRFPNFPLLTENVIGGAEGVHLKTPEQLGTSKHQVNIDMLVDFFTLASCAGVLSTSRDSRFANEALRLSRNLSLIIQ